MSETDFAHDPQAPVTESEIASLLRATGGDFPILLCPRAAVRELRKSFRADGVVVCDAETDADLDAIAEAALSLSPVPALVGSAGLAAAVGRRLLGPPEPPRWGTASAAPILGVLASASANLPRQVAAAESGDIETVPVPCAPGTIVRNLTIVQLRPRSPTLSCRNKIGPLLSSRTQTAIVSSNGRSKMSRAQAAARASIGLTTDG